MVSIRSKVNGLITGPIKWAKGVHYGWWLAALSFLVMVIANVPLFQAIPTWFVVLRNKFGWSAGQLSWAFALTRPQGAILGPIAGYFTDRVGARRMVLVGLPLQGIGFILFSQVNELWHLYAAFLVMAMGSSLGVWLPMVAALNNWFTTKRAIAMGIPMAGFLYGGVLLIPVLAWVIDPEQFGPDRWRAAAAAIGVFLIIVGYPVSRLVRNRPEEYGQRPYGEPETHEAIEGQSRPASEVPSTITGYRWRDAIRMREFWMIAFGHAFVSAMYSAVMVHIGLMLDDRGLSLQTVAWIVATIGLVGGTFTMVGGWVESKIPIGLAIFGFSIVQSMAVLVLVFADTSTMGLVFAVLLGIGFGGRIPLTTAARGIYFGRREFAHITALSQIPLDGLHFVTPVLTGYMRDASGTYDLALIIVVVVGIIGSTLFLMLPPPGEMPVARRAQRGL